MKVPAESSDFETFEDHEISSVAAAIVDAFAETVRVAAPNASNDEFDALLRHFCAALRRRFEDI